MLLQSSSQAKTQTNEQPVAIDATNTKKEIREQLREIMNDAWRFVRTAGISLSEALKKSWALFKLKMAMKTKICRFIFKKVDGITLRESYGTLCEKLMPAIKGTDTRKRNETTFTYYDTVCCEFRCFRKLNLISVEL